jgi:hypothetical protein
MLKTPLAALLLLLPGFAWAQAPTVALPTLVPALAQTGPHPAIWLLADADTRIYMFGTMHALSPDLRWRSTAFDRIVREADELVLEASDQELAARGPNPFSLMQMGKSVPILQRVSPDRRERLARMMRELGVPANTFDRVETWGVATLLGLAAAGRRTSGEDPGPEPDPNSGVEAVLLRAFHDSHRPVSGAESTTEVLGAFRHMSLDVQRDMLDQAIDAYFNGTAIGQPDERDWVTGRLDRLGEIIDSLPPQLHEMLITRRNRGFADWLAHRLDRPGTVLFAIGAGHLAGRVSVQSMLESRGLHVQRIY